MVKKYLILGGAGFIGSALARHLVELEGAEVTVFDDLSTGRVDNLPAAGRFRFIRGSIMDENDLKQAFGLQPDVVLHMAASFANLKSVENPLEDLRTNTEGTLGALQHAAAAKVKLFIYASSSCVYGDTPGPLDEKATSPKPFTPYAISKLASEHYGMFYRRYHGLPIVVLRYFNCYGPGELPGRYRGVIANFFEAALSERPLMITGSGRETRQFLYIDDAVRATLMAVEAHSRIVGETINISSGRDTFIMKLAEDILAMTGSPSPIQISPARDWDVVSHRCASTARAKELIGFSAATRLEDGLKMTAEYMMQRRRKG